MIAFVPGDPNTFFQVFDIVNVAWALSAGFTLGITVLLWLNLRYPPVSYQPPRMVFFITAILCMVVGTAFYTSQIFEAFVTGDTQSWRIVARWVLWLMFSVSVAAGLALGHKFAVDSPHSPSRPSREDHQYQEEG
jgi:hypothetical protein